MKITLVRVSLTAVATLAALNARSALADAPVTPAPEEGELIVPQECEVFLAPDAQLSPDTPVPESCRAVLEELATGNPHMGSNRSPCMS